MSVSGLWRRKVTRQQYLIAIETFMVLTQKGIKTTLEDDVECVLCVTQVEASTNSSLTAAGSVSSDVSAQPNRLV